MNCPRCHSERIHRLRRKGIIERRILAMLFVRPFRCGRCGYRFFRWSIAVNPIPSTAPTSIGFYLFLVQAVKSWFYRWHALL
jgi:predicted Zn-ribbon and HTH transcriptional regulator